MYLSGNVLVYKNNQTYKQPEEPANLVLEITLQLYSQVDCICYIATLVTV